MDSVVESNQYLYPNQSSTSTCPRTVAVTGLEAGRKLTPKGNL